MLYEHGKKPNRPHLDAWKSIPGYFDENDVNAIRPLVANRNVIEIGTMYGRSTVAIAAVANAILSIDNYTGDSMVDGRDYNEVMQLVASHGCSNCYLFQDDWYRIFSDPQVIELYVADADVIFYDAAHTPEDGYYEKDFLRLAHDTGKILAVHDYIPSDAKFRYVVDAVDAYERRSGRTRQGPVPNSSLVWFE